MDGKVVRRNLRRISYPGARREGAIRKSVPRL